MTTHKKAGRPPLALTAPAVEPAFDHKAIQAKGKAPAQLVAAHDAMDAVLDAGIDIGRLQALDFVATVATSAQLAIYEKVKKSKAWALLRNPESYDGRNFESLNEFCEVKLGKSYSRLQEASANRRVLGQEVFDQAERLGLRQRDYNAIKGLPAPDQELVRRAVEDASTRDEVVDLIQELAVNAAKHREDQQAKLLLAQEQNEDLKAELAHAHERNKALSKEARHLQKAQPDEVAAHLRGKVEKCAMEAQAIILGPIREGMEQLHAHAQANGLTQEAWMAGQLSNVVLLCKQVAGRVGVQLVDGQNPDWVLAEPVAGRVSGGGEPSFDPNA